MASRFDGRVAVVTGAGSGIGRAVATRLRDEGARLLLADIGLEGVTSVAESLGTANVARAQRVDVSEPADVVAMFEAAAGALGGIDVVCNNAGVLTNSAVFEDVPERVWQRTLDINLRGVILGCKYAIPHLRRRGGVIALTRSLRGLEADSAIRVTCVCPSFADTPMVHGAPGLARQAIDRFGLLSADEIARAIVFLASDEAAGLGGRAVRVVAGEEPALLANPRPERTLFGR